MKRTPTLFILLSMLACSHMQAGNGQRYLDTIFSTVTVDTGVAYGHNITMLYKIYGAGPGLDTALNMDVYMPAGDTATSRPLVIYLHTGNFLPILFLGQPANQYMTGGRKDSSCAEMCRQFAKRGYVAASIDYRLGWNPISSDPDVRTGMLLRAVYRAVQDTRTCVRFFKNDAATSNTYKIDTTRVVVGAEGAAGYVAWAVGTLDDTSKLLIPKFIDTSGVPYVSIDSLGDIWGFGGIPDTSNPNAGNVVNYPGISSSVAMTFEGGGALADSTWLDGNSKPMIEFEIPSDAYTPYYDGTVIVPTTGDAVIAVMGAYTAMVYADNLGVNNVYNDRLYTDAYTLRANSVNQGALGLFPFYRPANDANNTSPWEWWNTNDLAGQTSQANIDSMNSTALASNPHMSKTQALHFIDTMQNYLAPRMVVTLGLPGQENFVMGINEQVVATASITVAPNPASGSFNVVLKDSKYAMQTISLFDITGRLVGSENINNLNSHTIQRKGLEAGVYFVNIRLSDGTQANSKVVFE